ncbi:hypothetical protein EMN47_20105 [Prolixibacteraceae bacterium JC049]|nr:hypothetical protein [Prolixibacteraceae bacterium JC049]
MNNITPLSPFSERRREKETPPTPLYLNYSEYTSWITTNNFVIEGTRGTGKTSILKTLNYETLWLQKTKVVPSTELPVKFIDEPDFIGIYLRCEEIEKSLWNRWYKKYTLIAEDSDESEIQILFATFLNYYFVEQILKAIIEISNDEFVLKNTASLIEEIIHLCYPIEDLKPTLYDFSLPSLKKTLNTTLHNIRKQVYSLEEFKNIDSFFCLHTAASCLVSKAANLFNSSIENYNNLKYFLLIDDVDRLDTWQLKIINTFISSSEAPISLKLTCTGDYPTKISTNGRSISTTDLFISKLNDEEDPTNKKSNKTIDELFSAIFNFRLESRDIKNTKSLNSIFEQSYNFEDIFIKTLKTSANTEIKDILKGFEKNDYYNRLSDFFIDKYQIDDRYNKQTLLKEKQDLDSIDHKYYSKYRISIIFSILHHYNLQESFSYYSFDIIKMLSSGSPRHFLRICDKLWEVFPEYFLKTTDKPISFDKQNRAIREASTDVYNNIEFDELDGKIEVSYKVMCKRLADLFISFLKIESIKITPECQSLLVDLDKLIEKDKMLLLKILDRLRMFEAIKIKQLDQSNRFLLALSPMLAPVFSLPYRSPFSYYYTLPTPSLLLKLLTTSNNEAASIIGKIYADRTNIDTNPKLFSNE